MRTIVLCVGPLAVVAAASLTPSIAPRQSYYITFTVKDFTAFMANPYVEGTQSNLSFHVIDSRPNVYAEADCAIPPTYFSLYAITALDRYCSDYKSEFTFQFQEGTVAIRRTWTDPGTNKSYTASGSLNPYWKEGGQNPNVTVTPTGKLFTHTSDWLFPVNRLQPAT